MFSPSEQWTGASGIEFGLCVYLLISVNRSIGESLASMQKLQALGLFAYDFVDEAMKPLAGLCNLKHLVVQGDLSAGGSAPTNDYVVRSILVNSRLTIQSLSIDTNAYSPSPFHDWEKAVSGDKTVSSEEYQLQALQSLSLGKFSFSEPLIASLQAAIDFLSLRHLILGSLQSGQPLFFQHLATLMASATDPQRIPTPGITLQYLSMSMAPHDYRLRFAAKQEVFDAKCRFLSSFNTLTNLTLHDYGQYREGGTDPGLSDTLLQAILSHRTLKSLRLAYRGKDSDYKIPTLSASAIGTLVDNLPLLEEIEFSPDESEMVNIFHKCSIGPLRVAEAY